MGLKTTLIATLIGAAVVGGAGMASAGAAFASTAPNGNGSSTATSPNPPAPAPACDPAHDGEWPDAANGRPADFDAGDAAGVYLWHDHDGWHLRTTDRTSSKHVYTGTIETPGQLTAQRVRDEKDDKLVVGPHGHRMEFRFATYNGIDGANFQTKCAPRLHINLKVDGHPLPLERVTIGHGGSHPTSMPFVIQRAA